MEAVQEKRAAFILTMAVWRCDPGQNTALVCVRDGDSVLWFSVYVGFTLEFVSDFTAACLWFFFLHILEVGHRIRPEGGCLKTDYGDSFPLHVRVKKLDLCE